MSTLLELRGVEKRYNNGTLALLDSLDTAGRLWLEGCARSKTRPRTTELLIPGLKIHPVTTPALQ